MEYKQNQLTKWFDIKKNIPYKEGVYEVSNPGEDYGVRWFAFWNGCCFWYNDTSILNAFENRFAKTDAVVSKWRGLKFDPSLKND